MFDENNDEHGEQKFTINKRFERSFNERKRREDVEYAKSKFGKSWERQPDQDDDYESDIAEDENAELDNDDIALKVLTTISKLRTKNPSIYEKDKKFFDVKDYADGLRTLETGQNLGKRKTEPMTYKKLVREQAARGDFGDGEDEVVEDDETPYEVQQRIKNEFKNAARFHGGEEEGEPEDEGDLFYVKKKTKQEKLEEETEFSKFLASQKQKSKEEAKELQKVWGNTEKMADDDKFLRHFLLTKGWMERSDQSGDEDYTHSHANIVKAKQTNKVMQKWEMDQEAADHEDEQREKDFETYEEKVNFRFEQPGGTKLTTYERKVDDSMRQKDSTRADARKDREQRKKEEKAHFRNEVDHIRNLKRQEIEKKIKKLMGAGGISQLRAEKVINKLMDEDFNDEKYDKEMENVYNEEYYDDEEEDEEELKRYVEEVDENINKMIAGDTAKDTNEEGATNAKTLENEEEDTTLKPSSNVPIMIRKKINKEEAQVLQQSMKDNLWWYCDNCQKGIKPLDARFDCMECEDYTECKKCSEMRGHDHKMKKFIVPEGCIPPSDEEIQKIVNNYKICSKCENKVDNTQVYYKSKENEDYLLCDTCMHFSKKKRNKKLYDKVIPSSLSMSNILENEDYHKLLEEKGEGEVDNELRELVDDYYNIDFEDVIAGGLKTKFKYVPVDSNDYNLDDADIFFADDRVLNRYLSIKKLAPYKGDE